MDNSEPSSTPGGGWVHACSVEEIGPGACLLVRVGKTEIALFNILGTVFAIDNRCPHRGGPLIRGYTDETGGIKCPMHGWRFDLRTGASRRPATATVYQTNVGEHGVYILAVRSVH